MSLMVTGPEGERTQILMWKLVIEDDEGKRTIVPLTRDEYSIGRKEGNTIRLTERNVSRDHAKVARHLDDAGRSVYSIEDLTSYNGVFVNGLRVGHSQDLVHGDLIQIGDYRVVLQDDALSDGAPSGTTGARPSITDGGGRASQLMEKPNRLVMLAGPTPGAEYPLDADRITVGRADDAGIAVNHNSVSRLHCEVHALGDGRFEIVDKGSANGVRVNGADLRRGIIEAGDVIELGDVRFRFVGAGQIFLPGATDSQRLAAISDRTASSILGGRRSSNALPIAIFFTVVILGAGAVWLSTTSHSDVATTTPHVTPVVVPAVPVAEEVKATAPCPTGDCAPGAKPGLAPSMDPPNDEVPRGRDSTATGQTVGVAPMAKAVTATPAEDAPKPEPGVKPAPSAVAASALPPVPAPSPVRSALAPATPEDEFEREKSLVLRPSQTSYQLLKKMIEAKLPRATDAELKFLKDACAALEDPECKARLKAELKRRAGSN